MQYVAWKMCSALVVSKTLLSYKVKIIIILVFNTIINISAVDCFQMTYCARFILFKNSIQKWETAFCLHFFSSICPWHFTVKKKRYTRSATGQQAFPSQILTTLILFFLEKQDTFEIHTASELSITCTCVWRYFLHFDLLQIKLCIWNKS